MKLILERIGDTDVFIQAMDGDIENIHSATTKGSRPTGKGIKETGIEESVRGAYSNAKSLIKNIVEDLGRELDTVREKAQVKQMEVEFSIGFSAEAKPWVVFTTKADSSLKVKLIWHSESK